jgi:valyl-tRNA synthetase
MIHPFMPFLSEELWQRLPRRPGDSTPSITVAAYPEHDKALEDPEAEKAYELLLDCSRGIRSLLSEYKVLEGGDAYLHCLNDASYATANEQITAIRALTGKGLGSLSILKPSDSTPKNSDVRVVSTDAEVFLDITGRIDVPEAIKKTQTRLTKASDAARKQKEIMAKDDFKRLASEAVLDMEQQKLTEFETEVRNLEATLAQFEKMKIES